MAKVHNYSAGPCILPQEVIKEAAEAVLNFDGLNLSILEISHRSPNFVTVMDEAVALVKELLEVPAGYSVCWFFNGRLQHDWRPQKIGIFKYWNME